MALRCLMIRGLVREAEEVLARFVLADGRVEFDNPAHIVGATR